MIGFEKTHMKRQIVECKRTRRIFILNYFLRTKCRVDKFCSIFFNFFFIQNHSLPVVPSVHQLFYNDTRY